VTSICVADGQPLNSGSLVAKQIDQPPNSGGLVALQIGQPLNSGSLAAIQNWLQQNGNFLLRH